MSTLLVDSSFMAKRAYHGFPEIRGPDSDIYRHMIRGFFMTVFSIYFKLKPERMILCFDGRSKYRYNLLPQYKGNREHDPIWGLNMSIIMNICTTLNIEWYIELDFEADDLIATLTRMIPGVINIATADKDMAQLINHRINCYNPVNGLLMNHSEAIAKFGVRPDQMVDYLSMVSDTVDNVSGCDGIGKIIAANLLSKYQNVESIIIDELPNKIKENFRKFRCPEHYGLAKNLITLLYDVPIKLEEKKMNIDYDKFRTAYIPKIWDIKPDFLNKLEPLIKEKSVGGLAELFDF